MSGENPRNSHKDGEQGYQDEHADQKQYVEIEIE
jgi:hypothetical protein